MASGNPGAVQALLERLIELKPDDYNIRFNVAYKHNDQGNEELAVYHYHMIPFAERSAIAWNNLGASLDQLKLSAKAVDAYERASEMGETLAMSNLGNKFMSAGFIKEAQANCDKAIATGNPHKNVGHLLTALKELPEEEETKQKELLDRAKLLVVFLQQLGMATASNEPESLGESWQAPDCVLNVYREGNFVRFTGAYERTNSLLGLLGAIGAPPSPTKLKYSIVYSGTLRGRAIFGAVDRKNEGTTLAGSSVVHSKALMYFSEDGRELVVMEAADTTNPAYFRFRRVQLLSAHIKQ
jgi:hypothetical protein